MGKVGHALQLTQSSSLHVPSPHGVHCECASHAPFRSVLFVALLSVAHSSHANKEQKPHAHQVQPACQQSSAFRLLRQMTSSYCVRIPHNKS